MPKLVKAAGGALRVIRLGAPRPGPKTVARSPIASNSESTMVAASLAYSSMNAARASAGHHGGIGSCVAYTAAMAASSSTKSITTQR